MKRKKKLHNFLIRCITDVAIFNIAIWGLLYDMWPLKSSLLVLASVTWILIIIEANTDI